MIIVEKKEYIDMKNDDFFNKILKKANTKKKYGDIDMLIYHQTDSIIKALNLNISIKAIYETIIDETDIKVSYQVVYRKIKNLKNIQESFKTQVNQTAAAVNLQINENESLLKEDKENRKDIQDEPKIISAKQKKFSYNNEK